MVLDCEGKHAKSIQIVISNTVSETFVLFNGSFIEESNCN